VFISVLAFYGCNPFAPKYDENLSNRSSLISDQKNVEGVFTNFRYAYTFQDTSIYGKLLSPNFIFTYRDYDNGVDVSWNRDEEMRVTNGLFHSSENLDLIWNKIISISDDSTNIVRSFNLTVTFNPTDIIFVDGRVNFQLEKNKSGKWVLTNWVDESNY
jgi:hypothetical protein